VTSTAAAAAGTIYIAAAALNGRGLHSSTFQLNLSRFWRKNKLPNAP